MKKLISLGLSLVLASSVLASCGTQETDTLDPAITLASSDAQANAQWLSDRLGEFPENVTVGIGSNDTYGINMAEFENDGYILRTIGDETLIFGKTADGLDRAVRKYAKAAETGTTAELDEVYHEGYRIKRLTIAGRDISEYTIYYPEDANENMLFAITELKRLVKKACGAELPSVQGAPSGAAIEFRFSDDASLKNDGYKYTVTDSGIVFKGAVKRGCMNAVWRFLENECGWTSLTYGDSYLLPTDHLDVPAGTEASETPAFDYVNPYRNAWGSYVNEKGTPGAVQNSYGSMSNTSHGLYRFDDINSSSGAQICYSDEENLDIVEENLTAYLYSLLNSGHIFGVTYFGVDLGQNDSSAYCLCKDCVNLRRAEGSNSAAVILFFNELIERMPEEFEGLYYKIYAYAGTNVPPNTVIPNKWLHITFCTDFNCSNHKIDGSECGTGFINAPSDAYPRESNNADYDEWLRRWCEITDSVYCWFYALDNGFVQFTTLYNMCSDFRHLRDLGVDGIFWQCQFDGLGIQRVQHQLLMELNWNMDMTEDEFEERLCFVLEKEYGDGWDSIHQYIDLWEQSQDLEGCWHCWFYGPESDSCYNQRVSIPFVEANFDNCVKLFEDALANANCAAQQSRIEWLYSSMIYKGCLASYFKAEERGDTERMQVLSDKYALMIEMLEKNGFDPTGRGIMGVDGVVWHTCYPTLAENAEKKWSGFRDTILND